MRDVLYRTCRCHLLCLVMAAFANTAMAQGRDQTRKINVGGTIRHFIVHDPVGNDQAKRLPLVLFLHGSPSNGALEAFAWGLKEKADDSGFRLAILQGQPCDGGYGNLPRDFGCWNSGAHAHSNANDIAYIAGVVDKLTAEGADARRVFLVGMSDGGIMAYRAACELADKIAAIAPIAGTLDVDHCAPSRPVSVVHFHGTSDALEPFKGTKGLRSAAASTAALAALDGCGTATTAQALPDVAHDGTKVVKWAYKGCGPGMDVELFEIDGGGHNWPGWRLQRSDDPLPRELLLGTLELIPGFVSTGNVNANEVWWNFFQRHPSSGLGH